MFGREAQITYRVSCKLVTSRRSILGDDCGVMIEFRERSFELSVIVDGGDGSLWAGGLCL